MSKKKIKRSELSILRMVAGGEKRYSKVIICGILHEFVAIGWVEVRKATKKDYLKYPEAID